MQLACTHTPTPTHTRTHNVTHVISRIFNFGPLVHKTFNVVQISGAIFVAVASSFFLFCFFLLPKLFQFAVCCFYDRSMLISLSETCSCCKDNSKVWATFYAAVQPVSVLSWGILACWARMCLMWTSIFDQDQQLSPYAYLFRLFLRPSIQPIVLSPVVSFVVPGRSVYSIRPSIYRCISIRLSFRMSAPPSVPNPRSFLEQLFIDSWKCLT